MPNDLINIAYLVAAIFFIVGLKGLSHPRSAVRGNVLAGVGMLLAIIVTLLDKRIISFQVIVAGFIVGA